jgi:hypothetical protein
MQQWSVSAGSLVLFAWHHSHQSRAEWQQNGGRLRPDVPSTIDRSDGGGIVRSPQAAKMARLKAAALSNRGSGS